MKPIIVLLLCLTASLFAGHASSAPKSAPRVVSTEVIGPFTGADARVHPGNEAPLRIEYYGTDLGFSYAHAGQIHFLFGDTWATEAYAPIQDSTGSRQDDGFGTVAIADWPDPAAISGQNIPLILLAQNPGTSEMSAQDPGHVMDLGKTPMAGFSNGDDQFAIFNVTKPWGCTTDADCSSGLSCDTGLGYVGVSYAQQDSLTLPCLDGNGICIAETRVNPTADPAPASGFCSDMTSTIRDDTPAGRVQAVALQQRIGIRSETDPRKYGDIQHWLTNKFLNMTVRTVQSFIPENGTEQDYQPAGDSGDERRVLIWGRPGFIGVGANGRTMGLYFAYVDMPIGLQDGAGFSWKVNYFTHTVGGVPQFSHDERAARPLDLDAQQAGAQTAEQHDITHQMTVAWIEPLDKWVMFYGGGITTLPSPPFPDCGVLQLFTGSECKNVVIGNGAIRMRTADNPWGPWSPPQDVIAGGDPAVPGSGQYGPGGMLHHPACTADGCAPHSQTPFYHTDEYGFFYSANIIEQWTRPAGEGVDVLWNASTWDPYRVVLLRTRINP